MTKPSDCKALVDIAIQTFGRIDVLNNAAMAYFNWIEDITDELTKSGIAIAGKRSIWFSILPVRRGLL